MTPETFIKIFGSELRSNPHVSESCKNAINIIAANGYDAPIAVNKEVQRAIKTSTVTPSFSTSYGQSKFLPSKIEDTWNTKIQLPGKVEFKMPLSKKTGRYYRSQFLALNDATIRDLRCTRKFTCPMISQVIKDKTNLEISSDIIQDYTRKTYNVKT